MHRKFDFNVDIGRLAQTFGSSLDDASKDFETLATGKGFVGALWTCSQEGISSPSSEEFLWFRLLEVRSLRQEDLPSSDSFDNQIKGIKIHPRRLGRVPRVDELGEVFEWAQSQEKIVFICGYPPIGPGLTGGMDLLSRIADALSEFPNTTLVIGHAGVPNLLSASEIARRFPNVYLDLSLLLSRMSTTSLVTDLRWLLETLDTRLLFGSDYPDQDWLAAVDSMNDLEAGLPEAKVKNVWSDNAMRILGLLEHEK